MAEPVTETALQDSLGRGRGRLRVLVTGVSGYLGGRVARNFDATYYENGWRNLGRTTVGGISVGF